MALSSGDRTRVPQGPILAAIARCRPVNPSSEDLAALLVRVHLTPPQRKALEHIANNSGKFYGSRRDFPSSVGRLDVFERLLFAGLIEAPRTTKSRTWEVTPAGLKALIVQSSESGEGNRASCTNSADAPRFAAAEDAPVKSEGGGA